MEVLVALGLVFQPLLNTASRGTVRQDGQTATDGPGCAPRQTDGRALAVPRPCRWGEGEAGQASAMAHSTGTEGIGVRSRRPKPRRGGERKGVPSPHFTLTELGPVRGVDVGMPLIKPENAALQRVTFSRY